jgi:glycine/D-amino acid oxidase-like deaminating enzyme
MCNFVNLRYFGERDFRRRASFLAVVRSARPAQRSVSSASSGWSPQRSRRTTKASAPTQSYPSTPDQHPIIDRTEAGMVVVGGFAGLGLMHAPAAGLLASELILDGEIRSVNPADVSLARFSRPIESVERTGF